MAKKQRAAIGFRAHSGWAALVALFLENGRPVVVLRRRVRLVQIFSYQFRQPYHTARLMPPAEGRAFVSGARRQARQLAARSIREVRKELAGHGLELDRAGLCLASGRALPGLEKILLSHPLIHTADGELFREALAEASKRCGLKLLRIKQKGLLEQAGGLLGQKPGAVLERATKAGRGMGPPWTQDEKFAMVAAWVALGGGVRAGFD